MVYSKRYSYLLNFSLGDAFLAILEALISKKISPPILLNLTTPKVQIRGAVSA